LIYVEIFIKLTSLLMSLVLRTQWVQYFAKHRAYSFVTRQVFDCTVSYDRNEKVNMQISSNIISMVI